MKVSGLILVCLFALAACDIKEEENVLVLTNDNFDKAVEEHEHILVEFYAPWCGHCQAFAPEYERVASLLSERNSPVVVAKVDVSSEKELASEQKIYFLPTLKFFHRGDKSPLKYNGPRSAESLVAWLNKKSGPPSVEVHSVKEINEQLDLNDVIVLAFFRDASSSSYETYMETADQMLDTIFLHTYDDTLFRIYKIKEDNAIILLKKYDHGRDDFEGVFTIRGITDFIKFHKLHMVVDFDKKVANIIFDQQFVREFIVLFTNFSDESFKDLKEGFRSVAYNNKGKYLFVIVNLDVLAFLDVFKFFSVDYKEGTALRYIDMRTEDSIKFKYDGDDYSAIGITNFIKAVEQGTLKRFMKGEPLPDDWDANPVKTLVQQNFDDVALDETKAVLVEFFSPLCFNCKALHPVFDQLAEHYKNNPDIVIAKTNALENEYPQFTFKRYPGIVYFPKHGKPHVYYRSDMLDLDELIKFVDAEGYPTHRKIITTEDIAARRAAEERARLEALEKEKADHRDLEEEEYVESQDDSSRMPEDEKSEKDEL